MLHLTESLGYTWDVAIPVSHLHKTMLIEVSRTDQEALLKRLLLILADRGLVRNWSAMDAPRDALTQECRRLGADSDLKRELEPYLRARPIIVQSVRTFLSYIAMAANTRWQDTPEVVHSLSQFGWSFQRWLPTFLIIDGPLGRLLRQGDSPLNIHLRGRHAAYPALSQARDLFKEKLFQVTRNGMAHMSFTTEVQKGVTWINIIAEDTGRVATRLTSLEADALHLASFTIIETVDREIFDQVLERKVVHLDAGRTIGQ